MKKIFYILVLILVSFGLKAQTLPSGAPSPNSPTGYSLVGYVRSGKAFVWTKTDTTFTATYPSVVWSPDGNFYKTDGGSGSHWSLWIPATPTLGTVTSVATNNGTGITGGTITSTGTLANDTTLLSTRLWRQKGIDSLIGLINLKLNISDTAAMLSNLLRKTDTATMLNGYARSGNVVPNTRTINTNAPLTGGGNLGSNLTLVADTGRSNAQLVSGGSLNKVRDSLQANITAAVSGVSSVSTTDNYGISSSVSNPTTTPNISIGVDTLLIIPYTDTLKVNGIATKTDIINAATGGTVTSIATTNGILGGTITTTGTLQVDSSVYSTKANVVALLLAKLNLSDTSTMLNPYLRKTDTLTMLNPYLRKTDTANMLTGYTRVQRFLDTTSTLRSLINTKGTGTVTSVALSLPSFITVTGSPITTSGTLTGTLANQTANTVFSGPTTGSAAQPTFRALVAADLPDNYLPISDTAAMLSGYNLQRVTNLGSITYNPILLGKQSLPFLFLQSGGSNYGTIQSDANNEWALGYSDVSSTLGTPVLKWDTTGVIKLPKGALSDTVINYNGNYGSLFTNNSLITKNYADSLHTISGIQYWQRNTSVLSPLNYGDDISTTGNITDRRLNTDSLLSNTHHKIIVYDTVLFNRPTRFFDSTGIFPSQLGDLYKSQAVQINGALEMYSNAVGTLGRDIDFIKTRNGSVPSPGDEFGYINGRTIDTSNIGPNSAPAIQEIFRVGQHVGLDFTSGILEFKIRSTDGEYPGFNNLILNDKKQAVVGQTLIVGDSVRVGGNQFFDNETNYIQFGTDVNTAPFLGGSSSHDIVLGNKNLSRFKIDSNGYVFAPYTKSSTQTEQVYYNNVTGEYTHGALPTVDSSVFSTKANVIKVLADSAGQYQSRIQEKFPIAGGNVTGDIILPYGKSVAWNSISNQYITSDANFLYLGAGNAQGLKIAASDQSVTAAVKITSPLFVKTGGTSSQALIADGSVLTVASANTASAIVQRDGSGNFAANNISLNHLIGTSGSLSSTGLGTNVSSITISGTDLSMSVTVTTSGAVSGTVGTINFNNAFGVTPRVVISCANTTTAAATSQLAANGTGTGTYIIAANISGAGTYVYNVIVAQ